MGRIWGACIAALIGWMILSGGLSAASAASSAPPAEQLSPASPTPPPHLGYGVNVRLEQAIDPLFAPLGLAWIKLWEEYEDDPPSVRLPYQVLFAIQCDGVPADLDEWGDKVERIARDGKGFVEAYEICNEPNTERFWGGAPPDPAQYVQVLQVAYARIKAVDPAAIVVSAGLAPVGRIEGVCNGWNGNNCGAMDEREYVRQMLLLGAGDAFDVLGYHPYGFAYEPETDPAVVSNGFAFRGTEVIYDLLVQHGLAQKSIWATEFNWLRDWTEDGGMPTDCLAEYEAVFGWMEVSEEEQAEYITRAFQYADEHWPWMGAMFVWNLDWHNYHPWDCEAARYFSLRRRDGTLDGVATSAYTALQTMEKRPGHFGPRLVVEPAGLPFWMDVWEPGVLTSTLVPGNEGYRLLTWTTSVATGLAVTPTLVVTTGVQGAPLTVTVDGTGYPVGVFTGCITVTGTTTDVLNAPQTIPVTLTVVEQPPRLAVLPSALSFVTWMGEPRVFTGVIVPTNTGHHVLTWTATVVSGMQLTGTGTLGVQVTPTLAVTTGLQGTPLTITIDSTGYSLGTFIGIISVRSTVTGVLDSPQMVPVTLRVVSGTHHVYLPVILSASRRLE